jgi:hypothetical protein
VSILLLWLMACQCGQAPDAPLAAEVGPAHFGRFHGLVNTAIDGDVEASKFLARSLQEGDVPEVVDDGGGHEKVGGGLGYVQMAQSPEDVVDGLAAAAVGCGLCHSAAGVQSPQLGAWTHESAGLRLVLGAVFDTPSDVPADGAELAGVRQAWEGAADQKLDDRLAAALMACLRCHAAAEVR